MARTKGGGGGMGEMNPTSTVDAVDVELKLRSTLTYLRRS